MMLQKVSALSLGLMLITAMAPKPALITSKLWSEPVQAQGVTPTAFPLPSSVPAGTAIRVDGSESMVLINQALKQKFEAEYAGTSVELANQGTDAALKSVLDGSIDLAAIGRPLTAAETQQGLISAPISREKIAIIIGSDNPFKGDLTFEQFAKIFRGEITDWSEVGGAAGPIRLIDRPDFSDTRRALSTYDVFLAAPFQTGANATQLAADDTSQVIAALGKDGISYTIANQVQGQSNVQILRMHGTLPDDPRYPYSQPRGYAYKTASPAVQAFLGYANAPAGQQAIAAARAGEAAIIASPAAVAASPVAPSPVAPSPVAPSPAAPSPVTPAAAAPATPAEGGAGWLPWLLLPLAGLGLWWALRGRGQSAAVAPTPTTPTPIAPTPIAPRPTALPVADAANTSAPDPVAPVSSRATIPVNSPARPSIAPPVAPLAAAAGLGAVGAAGLAAAITRRSRIVLTARTAEQGYAYWEAPESEKAALRQRGGEQLTLRIADVTGLSPDQPPHSIQDYICAESDQDRHLPLPQVDRDYVAEIGYLTDSSTGNPQWLPLARSLPIRTASASPTLPVAAPKPAQSPSILPAVPVAAAATAATAATVVAAAGLRQQSRIVLSPYDAEQITARWEAPESEKAALRQQGGNRFTLRLYDATGAADLQQSVLTAVSDYGCAESAQDLTVPVPEFDHDYVAEIGYWTPTQRWLSLARSNAMRLKAPAPTGLAQTAVAASKFVPQPPHLPNQLADLDVSSLASVDENLPELPSGYGESNITLLPRDPQWVYAYWDVPDLHKQALRQQGGQRFALRFYDTTDARQTPPSLQQYECDELARDWYIPVPVSDREYVAELGYVTEDGRWLLLTRSNPVRVPPIYATDWYEEQFATISWTEDLPGKSFGNLTSPAQKRSIAPIQDQVFGTAKFAEAQIAGSLFGSMHQVPAVSSFALASGLGMQTASGAGLMSGAGMSGAGISGIGILGMGLYTTSGVGMSGAGMSGVGMSGISTSGIGISGIGLYTLSGMGMSGVGMMSGASIYTMSGIGISGMYTMSGIGMSGIGMSGVGMMSGIGMSGVGMMSGIGMYSTSGAGMYGMSGIGMMSGAGLYSMSGIGMSGAGIYTMSGMGMSGLGMMSGAGLYSMSGMGMSGIGMSGIGMYSASGMGMSGAGMYTMSGAGMSGLSMSGAGMVSGMGMYSTSGFGLSGMSGAGMMSGIGMMSGAGIYTVSGMGMSGLSMSGAGMMSGMGMYSTSGAGMMSGVGMMSTSFPSMSGVGMMSGIGMMSGAGMYSMSGAGMSGIGMSGAGMSGIGMSLERSRKFWLIGDAELIVYGATEPDANLTIGGRPVQLNPDGTFRFQMSFQDGLIDFPIQAVAADGEQSRSVHLKFVRETPAQNTNSKADAKEELF